MLGAVVLVGASVLFLLVAAKAHGRQLRLVREAAGFRDVTFGGENPPFVVALWGEDRRRYWTLAPAFSLLFAAVLLVRGAAWPAVALAALLWAPSAAFVASGLAAGTPEARRGNAGWWLATLLAATAVAVLAATIP